MKGRAHFEQTYTPGKGDAGSKLPAGSIRAGKAKDGWFDHGRNGRMLALVFGCSSRDEAAIVVDGALKRLNMLEARHE
jgi:hypothetical protein